MTSDELLAILAQVFQGQNWPKPLHVLQGVQTCRGGHPVADTARFLGTTEAYLQRALQAPDPVKSVLGVALGEVDAAHRQRAAQMLGQLVLGRCAEAAFERIYESEMGGEEFELRDLRESRTDTDYRLYNGRGRPVYRVNIKFHGSPFRRAAELVGLQPEDCFALATYKIHSALQKQQAERLPYLFAVVGVPNLTGHAVGGAIPGQLVETVALVDQAPRRRHKRALEDAVTRWLVSAEHPAFIDTFAQVSNAEWYVISARRAERLLRELLFDRVFALRVRGFARAFAGAELDMHFSLRQDLIPLRQFLRTLREDGPQRVTTLLERGEY
ncbi:MAG: hypothetical protein QME94_12830 [Anaerolineae bacterium]|nr:hypothetical protein [Anaerolineae bacterium]